MALVENTPEDIKNNYTLTNAEKDALGEIGNICMGTSATTLSTLLGKKVHITTPKVSICRSAQEMGYYQRPFVSVDVSYTEGIDGYNILLIKEDDVKVITDILMGGDGTFDPDAEIDELHFSAISEVMNQMVGSSSTALSSILSKKVNISPPNVQRILLEDDQFSTLKRNDEIIIKIGFKMEIEGVLNSDIMQIIPFEFGKSLAGRLLEDVMSSEEAPAPSKQSAKPAPSPAPAQPQKKEPEKKPDKSKVSVKSIQYESFDEPRTESAKGGDNINLILDVPLQVTVELGRCKKSIKEILAMNTGSVVVLDRLAGEMVDIMVNGKLFAKGEVVVIDDNYGVRVTDIIASPQF